MQQFKRLSSKPVVAKGRTIYTFPNISFAKFDPKASIPVPYIYIYIFVQNQKFGCLRRGEAS